MSTGKHTAGERWQISTGRGVHRDEFWIVADENHGFDLIAEVPDADSARLIAAAPELLQALRWYEEHASGCRKLGRIGDPARNALDADGGKRARAAIAKAAGTPDLSHGGSAAKAPDETGEA